MVNQRSLKILIILGVVFVVWVAINTILHPPWMPKPDLNLPTPTAPPPSPVSEETNSVPTAVSTISSPPQKPKVMSANGITGHVKLEGETPPEKLYKLSPDSECKHSTQITSKHYTVDANGGLANVFIYVKDGLGGKKFPVPVTSIVLNQQNCLYNPYVVGIQVGQTLEIKNGDNFMHNVHGTSPSGKNKEFNIGQPTKTKDKGIEQKFTKPEVFFEFKCDVHPWMLAYVGIVEHPFFTVTDTDGSFQIPDLPDGEYTLAAKHPKAGEQTAKVKVVGGKAIADFIFSSKTDGK